MTSATFSGMFLGMFWLGCSTERGENGQKVCSEPGLAAHEGGAAVRMICLANPHSTGLLPCLECQESK